MIQDAPPPPPPEAHALMLTGVGRFAVFADMATVRRDGPEARIRSLQVAEEAFTVGDKTYLGGWSWWRFDCAEALADRLDFASLAADRTEGPATPERQPPYPASPGGDAAELMAAACGAPPTGPIFSTVAAAVTHARARMAE